uniref:Protein phosphatase methylesterase 1 PME-1 n=1 Tax=Rhizophora mucronata TaxID=61149 RepID=A0A2P2JXZ4_RHIMU
MKLLLFPLQHPQQEVQPSWVMLSWQQHAQQLILPCCKKGHEDKEWQDVGNSTLHEFQT